MNKGTLIRNGIIYSGVGGSPIPTEGGYTRTVLFSGKAGTIGTTINLSSFLPYDVVEFLYAYDDSIAGLEQYQSVCISVEDLQNIRGGEDWDFRLSGYYTQRIVFQVISDTELLIKTQADRLYITKITGIKYGGGSSSSTPTDVKLSTEAQTAEDTIRFGIDENGNYGYYKVGADSVTPFRDGSLIENKIRFDIGNSINILSKLTNFVNFYMQAKSSVPIMKSNEQSGYKVNASGFMSSYYPWQAFGELNIGGNSDTWVEQHGSSSTSPCWIEISLPQPKIFNGIYLEQRGENSPRCVKKAVIQGSTNGIDYEDLITVTMENVKKNSYTFTLDNTKAYSYYRINIIEQWDSTYVGLGKIRFYEDEKLVFSYD